MNIKEFRTEHPEYNDMNDIDLTRALHKKYYSDMPLNAFASKFSVTQTEPTPSKTGMKTPDASIIYATPVDPREEPPRRGLREPSLFAPGIADPITQEIAKRFESDAPRSPYSAEVNEALKGKGAQMAGATFAGAAVPWLLGKIPPLTYLPEEAVTVPFGIKLTHFLAGVGGAAAGAAGATGWKQEYLKQTGSPKAPKSLREAYTEQLKAAIEEGAAEFVGRGIAGGVKKGIAPFATKTTPGAAEASQRLLDASRRMPVEDLPPKIQKLLKSKTWFRRSPRGAGLTPGQKTIMPTMDWLENATEGAVFGGNRIYLMKQVLNPRAWKQVTEELAETFWKEAGQKMSADEAGALFLDTVLGGQRANNKLASIMYKQVDTLTQGASVSLVGPKMLAKKLAKEASVSGGAGPSRAIQRLGKMSEKWPNDATFMLEAHRIRSHVIAEGRKIQTALGSKNPEVSRAVSLITGSIDQQMARAAREAGGSAEQAWRAANKVVKHGKKVVQKSNVKAALRMAEKNPEKVFSQFFVRNGTKKIRLLKGAVGPKSQTYYALRASWMEDILRRGKFDADALERTINDYGEDMLVEVFGKNHLKNIREVIQTGKLVQDPIGRSGGDMAIQLTQMGALLSLPYALGDTRIAATSGAVLLGPWVMGRALTNPTGAQLLAEGLKTPTGTTTALTIMTRLLKIAAETKLQRRKESKQVVPDKALSGHHF
jgi:hypothetical protein